MNFEITVKSALKTGTNKSSTHFQRELSSKISLRFHLPVTVLSIISV